LNGADMAFLQRFLQPGHAFQTQRVQHHELFFVTSSCELRTQRLGSPAPGTRASPRSSVSTSPGAGRADPILRKQYGVADDVERRQTTCCMPTRRRSAIEQRPLTPSAACRLPNRCVADRAKSSCFHAVAAAASVMLGSPT
jgi:hypothetical protein